MVKIKDVPEMDPMNEEQESKVTELLGKITAAFVPLPLLFSDASDDDRRILAYKFLVARKWKVIDAEKMIHETVDFRRGRGLDTARWFPSPYPLRGFDQDDVIKTLGLEPRVPGDWYDKAVKAVLPTYPFNYHAYDKLGHPVYIERPGSSHVKACVERLRKLCRVGETPAEIGVRLHCGMNETGAKLLKYMDKKTIAETNGRRRVLGVTAILDCAGLGYGHLYNAGLEVFKAELHADQSYYPEGLHQLFAVNCPSMIMFAYSIVRHALDPRLQQKVVFLNPVETPEALLQVIDAGRERGVRWSKQT